ncbi:TPA: hypothetical protein ACH3X2_007913 [Trebouxia sp. C0005]
MHSAKKQKVASFYSKSLPRPTVLLDQDGDPIRDRVDAPEPVTGALLEWAKHAPMNKGGAKPVFKGAPSACLTAFGAMVQDKRKELLEDGKMQDFYKSEPKSLQADARSAALKEWKLLDEEHRSLYQERAAADQTRWEKEVEVYEKKHPHYRSYLAQKHVKKLNDKGVIDIQLAQLGIKKPFTARHYYIKEQVEKRLKEDENLALEYSPTDLFEGTSIAKRKAWLDMADSGRRKYDKLAEEDKKRFEDQMQAHPKLAAMIEAYNQKKQDLKAIKKGKGKSSKSSKKRGRQEESPASDNEDAAVAERMDIDEVATAKTREPLAELARPDEPSIDAAAAEGASAQQPATDADEPVSDTDDEADGDATFGGELLETVQETQNDEEDQALTGSQASTLKQRLGMQKFGSFIAGLFTAKKSAKRSSGQGQLSQSAAAETEPEADDLPPIQNTLDSQLAEAHPGSALASAPAGPASISPQLPQQSLVEKLNDVAEEEPVMTKAIGTEDGSIAFVTEPGIAEGIQTSADAAAVTAGLEGAISPAGIQSSAGKAAEQGPTAAATQLVKDTEESAAGGQAGRSPAKTRTSRAAKAGATVRAANTAVPGSGERRSSARFSVDKTKHSGASAAGSNSTGKENATAVPAEEANHMAEKEPHSRVEEVTGSKGVTPSQVTSGNKKKEASDKRDPWIGRRIKKDFETDSGLKAYAGWIIGRHAAKKWYAVQYEDGDKEEFTPSQLKKKGVLQPEGEGDRTDFEELDRLYALAKAEWAAEEAEGSA